MIRILALVALLGTAACADPYGRTDYGRSALLGAGIGAAAGLLGGAVVDQPGYRRGHRGYGYGYGAYRAPVPYTGYGYGGMGRW